MIRFLAKVAVQHAIGALPRGPQLYDWVQRRVTRSIIAAPENVSHKRAVAISMKALVEAHGGVPIAEAGPHLDIGAGWLPVIPLVFRQFGLGEQVLVDIIRGLRPDTVFAAARLLDAGRGGLPALNPPETCGDLDGWLSGLGIAYRAPAWPPYPLEDGRFRLITCTQVFQSPPAPVVRAIHAEAARLLAPGGLYAATIRLDDQYARSDPSLPRFHFLRYGRATWERWFDNPMASFNRLRASDHAQLFEGLPLDRLVWDEEGGGPAELAELACSRPHPEFAGYRPEDMARTGLTFLMRRRS
ncbi:class I SAM-dependent methyltransferase [Azospirillum sp. sgz301742]